MAWTADGHSAALPLVVAPSMDVCKYHMLTHSARACWSLAVTAVSGSKRGPHILCMVQAIRTQSIRLRPGGMKDRHRLAHAIRTVGRDRKELSFGWLSMGASWGRGQRSISLDEGLVRFGTNKQAERFRADLEKATNAARTQIDQVWLVLQDSKSSPSAVASTAASHMWLDISSKHSNARHGPVFWQAQCCLFGLPSDKPFLSLFNSLKIYCYTQFKLKAAASTDHLHDERFVFCFDLIPIKGGSCRQGLCPTWRLLESSLNRHSQNCNSQHSQFIMPSLAQPTSGEAKMITCHQHAEQCSMWAATLYSKGASANSASFERLLLTLLSTANNKGSCHCDAWCSMHSITQIAKHAVWFGWWCCKLSHAWCWLGTVLLRRLIIEVSMNRVCIPDHTCIYIYMMDMNDLRMNKWMDEEMRQRVC